MKTYVGGHYRFSNFALEGYAVGEVYHVPQKGAVLSLALEPENSCFDIDFRRQNIDGYFS